MNRNNLKIILSTIGIAIVVALMGTATYAYFTLEIEGEGKNNTLSTFSKNMEITYTETSNVTLENAYTGDSLTKTFTVANTGNTDVYYNVTLEDVVNNFAKPEELQYAIRESNDVAYRNDSALPTSDATMLSDIKISSGETHSYTLEIIFLSLSNTDQSYNMGKTFSGKINVVPSENSSKLMNLKENSLAYKVMSSESSILVPENPITSKVTNLSSISSNIANKEIGLFKLDLSSGSEITSSKSVGYINNTYNGTKIYFYHGVAKTDSTNNVLFAGYCWNILRTTETVGVKMIYAGVPTDGACADVTGDDSIIGTSAFNTNADSNAYVGYMYGTPNSSTYAEEHKNANNSTIKTMLENWYENNLLQYNDYIEDTNYCNDRSMNEISLTLAATPDFFKYGYGKQLTGYSLYEGVEKVSCLDEKSKFSVNKKLNTYPIGLPSVDEIMLNGVSNVWYTRRRYTIDNIISGVSSNNNYKIDVIFLGLDKATTVTTFLNSSNVYWTMSPAYFDGTSAYNFTVDNNNAVPTTVDTVAGVRPVIALKSNVVVLSGDGSLSSPYKITE